YNVTGGVPDASRSPAYDIAKQGTYGTLFINAATGAYLYVPDNAKVNALKTHQSDSFTITVTDSSGATDTSVLTENLYGVNDTPVGVADIASAGENEAKTFNIVANDTDRDTGDVLTLTSIVSATSASSVTSVNGLN